MPVVAGNGRPQRSRLVVLGAGKPLAGTAPSALRLVDRRRKVLDWILSAFSQTTADVTFVGGYDMRDVVATYPDIRFIVNAAWEQTGATGSLMAAAPEPDGDLYVCYSDIVFRPELVMRMAAQAGDAVVIAVDRHQAPDATERKRMQRSGRETVTVANEWVAAANAGGAIAEFVGLVRLPASVVALLPDLMAAAGDELRRQHLTGLIAALLSRGIAVVTVDAQGQWSDLEDDRALTRFAFGSKADTLDRLSGRLKHASVPRQVSFTVGRWRAEPDAVTAELLQALGGGVLAIRSSAMTEDGFSQSNAGRFETALNVKPEASAVQRAVDQVIASYGDDRHDHQVFVQPMIPDIAWSGVLLTRTGQVGGPYITVAWSADGADGVTSGKAADQKTFVIHRDHRHVPASAPAGLGALLDAACEIEYLNDNDALDIEFAVDVADQVHILQVRPLVLQHERTGTTDGEVAAILENARARLRALSAVSSGGLLGRRAIWGQMPDWNPAEIVGARPGRLACSLYAHLICDEVWATQRAEYGYRDLRPYPLLKLFAGHAYVDVRASFNSFVPAALDRNAAAWLVDSYLERLAARPELHDKVEFEIALTCWSFDLDGRFATLNGSPQNGSVILDALRPCLVEITRNGIARLSSDLEHSARFEREMQPLLAAERPSLDSAIRLIELCRRNGTLPFAHLARGAFVAMTLLRSAVQVGLVRAGSVEAFLRSIRTVSHDLAGDARAVRDGKLSFDALVARYGHLRPGTYDVTSLRYADQPEVFLRPIVERASPVAEESFDWSDHEMRGLLKGLEAAGIELDADALDNFLRRAIEGREWSKFVFTRTLSQALDGMVEWGLGIGLSRADLAHLAFSDLAAVAQGALPGTLSGLRGRLDEGAAAAHLADLIELPPLLLQDDDIYGFEHPATEPNYVTQHAVIARPVVVDGTGGSESLAGRIVLIPRADPGFDWLFSQPIAGLVTAYGGANSHMAIRAAEFGLPAAIGVGEQRFRALQASRLIELDCRERRLRALELI